MKNLNKWKQKVIQGALTLFIVLLLAQRSNDSVAKNSGVVRVGPEKIKPVAKDTLPKIFSKYHFLTK